MKRVCAAAAAVVFASVALHADVTIKSTISIDGAAMGAQAPGPMNQVMRIKGMKSRVDMDGAGQSIVIIADMATKKVHLLNTTAKTAQLIDAASTAAGPAGDALSKVDVAVTPTGQSRSINNLSCQEYAFNMTMDMAEMAGGQMPPEAAEMMKGLSMAMKGSIWAAKEGPGAAELIAFTKASLAANLGGILSGGMPGKTNPALERLVNATAKASGLPCLTEMDMTVSGEGPMADMMRQAGAFKTTVKTTAISTETLADDLFTVPADYKITK